MFHGQAIPLFMVVAIVSSNNKVQLLKGQSVKVLKKGATVNVRRGTKVQQVCLLQAAITTP